MKKIGIMICRSASDPLKPGSTLGYFCAGCKKEVQVSRDGMAHVDDLYILCNPCGFAMRARLREAGADLNEQLSPTALEQLIRNNSR